MGARYAETGTSADCIQLHAGPDTSVHCRAYLYFYPPGGKKGKAYRKGIAELQLAASGDWELRETAQVDPGALPHDLYIMTATMFVQAAILRMWPRKHVRHYGVAGSLGMSLAATGC